MSQLIYTCLCCLYHDVYLIRGMDEFNFLPFELNLAFCRWTLDFNKTCGPRISQAGVSCLQKLLRLFWFSLNRKLESYVKLYLYIPVYLRWNEEKHFAWSLCAFCRHFIVTHWTFVWKKCISPSRNTKHVSYFTCSEIIVWIGANAREFLRRACIPQFLYPYVWLYIVLYI
jgi:hypothetical protein